MLVDTLRPCFGDGFHTTLPWRPDQAAWECVESEDDLADVNVVLDGFDTPINVRHDDYVGEVDLLLPSEISDGHAVCSLIEDAPARGCRTVGCTTQSFTSGDGVVIHDCPGQRRIYRTNTHANVPGVFVRIPWTRTEAENDWGTELADLDGDGRFERVDWSSDREGVACVGETDGRRAMFLAVIDGVYRWTTAGWVRTQPGAYAPAFRATVPQVLQGAPILVLHLDASGRAAEPGAGTQVLGNPGDSALLPGLAEAGVSVERMTDWLAAPYPPALRGEASDCVAWSLAAYREETPRWEMSVAVP